jgi:hypothetical protein
MASSRLWASSFAYTQPRCVRIVPSLQVRTCAISSLVKREATSLATRACIRVQWKRLRMAASESGASGTTEQPMCNPSSLVTTTRTML